MSHVFRNLQQLDEESRYDILTGLPAHLADGDQEAQLIEILTNFGFLQAKVRQIGIRALIDDYERVDHATLQTLGKAIRLSSHAVIQDDRQLAGQLFARLTGDSRESVSNLLQDAANFQEGMWLRPLTRSLMSSEESLVQTLIGHTDKVTALVLDSSETYLYSTSIDRTIRIWDLKRGEEVARLENEEQSLALALTADDTQLFSASRNKINVWDTKRRVIHLTLTGHSKSVTALVARRSTNHVISASVDSKIKIWDAQQGVELATLKGHTDGINSLLLSTEERYLLSASEDTTIRLWDLTTGQTVHVFTGHRQAVYDLSLMPSGNQFISASWDQQLKIWDIQTHKEVHSLHTSDPFFAVQPGSDGQSVITDSLNCDLVIRNMNQEAEDIIFRAHSNAITSIVLSHTRQWVISGSWDHTIKIWDINAAQNAYPGHREAINDLVISHNNQYAISASHDMSLKIWNLQTGAEKARLNGHHEEVRSVASFTLNNQQCVASTSYDYTLRIWNIETHQELFHVESDMRGINAVAITDDNKYIISDTLEGLAIYDVSTSSCLKVLQSDFDAISKIIVSKTDQILVSASLKGHIHIHDWKTGTIKLTLAGHDESISGLQFIPNTSWLLSASRDGLLKVWDLKNEREVFYLDNQASITTISHIFHAQYVVTGASDGILRIWNLYEQHLETVFTGESSFSACALDTDAKILVAGEESGRIHFFKIELSS